MQILRLGEHWIHYRDLRDAAGAAAGRAPGGEHQPSAAPARPVLVLAHALGMDLRMWDPLLTVIGGRWPVVVWDTLGHGLSAAPPCLSIDDQIAALAALLDHLAIPRAVVGGISMGGMIALGLAAKGHRAVAGVVGMATALSFASPQDWAARIRAVEAGGLEAIADATMARWFAGQAHATRRDEILGWRTLFLRTPKAGYLANCRALAAADLRGQAARITAPVLLLAGAEDPGPGPQTAAAIAASLPHAQARTIAKAAHLLAVDQPQETANALLSFLEGLTAQPPDPGGSPGPGGQAKIGRA